MNDDNAKPLLTKEQAERYEDALQGLAEALRVFLQQSQVLGIPPETALERLLRATAKGTEVETPDILH